MLHIKKILVPTDLSARVDRAFDLAAVWAEACSAEVHVLHVTPTADAGPLHALFRRFLEESDTREAIRERLSEHIENSSLERTGRRFSVQRVHRQGADEAREILQYASEEDIDLIVMGTHGRRGFWHPALGGTTGEVVRRAECPVLTTRVVSEEKGREGAPRSILVPIDFSEPSERTVPVAKELAALFGASLSLLFVAEERTVPVFSDTGLPGVTTLRMEPEAVEQADRALAQLFQESEGPAEVKATYHVRHGQPAREILDVADAQPADLIVMSTKGQTGHELIDLGSTAEKVVRQADGPVLTLRAAGKSIVGK